MASAFTHALVGAALAAGAPKKLRDKKFVALLVAVSIAPDLDVIAFAMGIPYSSPLGHRGFSHSVPFAVLVSLFALMLNLAVARRRSDLPRPSLPEACWRAGLLFAAVVSHGVLDAATDGGLGVGFWIPFDTSRYFLSWRPIPVSPIGIDAFFSARGFEILMAELRWVWVPTAALGIGVLYIRRRLQARPGDER